MNQPATQPEATLPARPFTRCGRSGCAGLVVVMSRYKAAAGSVDYLYCWKCGWRPTQNKVFRPVGVRVQLTVRTKRRA